MQEILAWMMLNRLLSAVIIATIFFTLLIVLCIVNEDFRSRVNFWWLNFKPFKVSILDNECGDRLQEKKFRHCETILCNEYYQHYLDATKHDIRILQPMQKISHKSR